MAAGQGKSGWLCAEASQGLAELDFGDCLIFPRVCVQQISHSRQGFHPVLSTFSSKHKGIQEQDVVTVPLFFHQKLR